MLQSVSDFRFVTASSFAGMIAVNGSLVSPLPVRLGVSGSLPYPSQSSLSSVTAGDLKCVDPCWLYEAIHERALMTNTLTRYADDTFTPVAPGYAPRVLSDDLSTVARAVKKFADGWSGAGPLNIPSGVFVNADYSPPSGWQDVFSVTLQTIVPGDHKSSRSYTLDMKAKLRSWTPTDEQMRRCSGSVVSGILGNALRNLLSPKRFLGKVTDDDVSVPEFKWKTVDGWDGQYPPLLKSGDVVSLYSDLEAMKQAFVSLQAANAGWSGTAYVSGTQKTETDSSSSGYSYTVDNHAVFSGSGEGSPVQLGGQYGHWYGKQSLSVSGICPVPELKNRTEYNNEGSTTETTGDFSWGVAQAGLGWIGSYAVPASSRGPEEEHISENSTVGTSRQMYRCVESGTIDQYNYNIVSWVDWAVLPMQFGGSMDLGLNLSFMVFNGTLKQVVFQDPTSETTSKTETRTLRRLDSRSLTFTLPVGPDSLPETVESVYAVVVSLAVDYTERNSSNSYYPETGTYRNTSRYGGSITGVLTNSDWYTAQYDVTGSAISKVNVRVKFVECSVSGTEVTVTLPAYGDIPAADGGTETVDVPWKDSDFDSKVTEPSTSAAGIPYSSNEHREHTVEKSILGVGPFLIKYHPKTSVKE